MGERSRLLLIESVIPTGNEFHPGKLLDYIMLTTLPGRERTEEGYESLLREADLRISKVHPTGSHMSIIEAVPNYYVKLFCRRDTANVMFSPEAKLGFAVLANADGFGARFYRDVTNIVILHLWRWRGGQRG